MSAMVATRFHLPRLPTETGHVELMLPIWHID